MDSGQFIPIRGYEGYYFINQRGEVISTYTGFVLKHGLSAGYPRVTLYKPGSKPKGVHIHRLLAEHFVANPERLPMVNHINGDRLDFSLDNLEWVSAQYNVKDGYNRGRKNWNNGLELVDRRRNCENCKQEFKYKRKSTRFCSTSCSAKWRIKHHPQTIERERDPITGRLLAIELFKQGMLKKD